MEDKRAAGQTKIWVLMRKISRRKNLYVGMLLSVFHAV